LYAIGLSCGSGERALSHQSGSQAVVGRQDATTPNYSVNHARSGSHSCSASIAPWFISISPLPAPHSVQSQRFSFLFEGLEAQPHPVAEIRKSSSAASQFQIDASREDPHVCKFYTLKEAPVRNNDILFDGTHRSVSRKAAANLLDSGDWGRESSSRAMKTLVAPHKYLREFVASDVIIEGPLANPSPILATSDVVLGFEYGDHTREFDPVLP
jgi:hypothetical protein